MEEFSKNTYPNYWLLQNEKSIRFQIENFFLGKKKETRFDFFIKKIDKNNFLEITIVTNDRQSFFLNLINLSSNKFLKSSNKSRKGKASSHLAFL